MNLWDQLLARIETKIGRHAFYTWFRPTAFVAEDRNSVTIRVPTERFGDVIAQLQKAAVEVRSVTTNSKDVTDEVTDVEATPRGVSEVVSTLWKEQPETFKALRQVGHTMHRDDALRPASNVRLRPGPSH